jgi:hypothetical protein
MIIFKLICFVIPALLISYGLDFHVKGVVSKALGKKTNKVFFGGVSKLAGFILLGGLILNDKTHDSIYGLIVFFLSFIFTISLFLLARRDSIG